MHIILYAVASIACLIAAVLVWDLLAARLYKGHKNLGDRVILWVARGSQVGCVDGIRLADSEKKDSFKTTIERALALIREHDPRRYRRVRRYIHWIVNHETPSGEMEYTQDLRLVMVGFIEAPWLDREVFAAVFACFLVHEATHGLIYSHGIVYDATTRARIERLCTQEQNRLAAKLAEVDPIRFPRELLHFEFDESYWGEAWAGWGLKRSISYLSRSLGRDRTEQVASPSGNPATADRHARSGDAGAGRTLQAIKNQKSKI